MAALASTAWPAGLALPGSGVATVLCRATSVCHLPWCLVWWLRVGSFHLAMVGNSHCRSAAIRALLLWRVGLPAHHSPVPKSSEDLQGGMGLLWLPISFNALAVKAGACLLSPLPNCMGSARQAEPCAVCPAEGRPCSLKCSGVDWKGSLSTQLAAFQGPLAQSANGSGLQHPHCVGFGAEGYLGSLPA